MPQLRATIFSFGADGSADRSRGSLALRLDLVDEAGQNVRTNLEWCARQRVTVAEFLVDWLKIGRTRLKASTYDGYERDVRNHYEPVLGALPPRDLRPSHIQAFINRSVDAGLSPRTVRRLYSQLHGALQAAVRLQLIALNQCSGASPPTAPHEEMRVLSVPEAKQLMKVTSDTPIHALVYVALETGARSGELLGLRWADVDLKRAEIRINRTVRETHRPRSR